MSPWFVKSWISCGRWLARHVLAFTPPVMSGLSGFPGLAGLAGNFTFWHCPSSPGWHPAGRGLRGREGRRRGGSCSPGCSTQGCPPSATSAASPGSPAWPGSPAPGSHCWTCTASAGWAPTVNPPLFGSCSSWTRITTVNFHPPQIELINAAKILDPGHLPDEVACQVEHLQLRQLLEAGYWTDPKVHCKNQTDKARIVMFAGYYLLLYLWLLGSCRNYFGWSCI